MSLPKHLIYVPALIHGLLTPLIFFKATRTNLFFSMVEAINLAPLRGLIPHYIHDAYTS